jgi:5-methyltetrahydropteroyltriglutamate--homocysteine methyltransferase
MRGSTDRILTTHVGALPIPPGLWGKQGVEEARLRREVADVVRLQREAGVDIVNEGELTKGGNWVSFINQRLTGFVPVDNGATLALLMQSLDWKEFKDFYQAALAGGTLFESTRSVAEQIRELDWCCTSAITYVGQVSLQQEIDSLRAALGGTPPSDAFLTSTAPASLEPGRDNKFYRDTESFLFALADSMAVEYEAIAKAGFIVQVDDAWLAALWDRIGIPMGLEGYRRYCRLRIEALNHALRNVPQSQVRYHLCWGSWHGPHSQDIGMKDMIDLLLSINAQAYLFEAANARHEHEYTLWAQVKIPEEKILIPGVVSHATTVVEHPELVSMRIQRFAKIVGRERVIAGTDCGLGLRCHPQVAWAKLKALSEGAALASEALWSRKVAT